MVAKKLKNAKEKIAYGRKDRQSLNSLPPSSLKQAYNNPNSASLPEPGFLMGKNFVNIFLTLFQTSPGFYVSAVQVF